jgi:hypothetical protein
MVSHGKVEESRHHLLALTEQALAVVGLPDRKKRERLVVLLHSTKSKCMCSKRN